MKIVVLHGDDIEASYARLVKITDSLKKRGWRVSELVDKDELRGNLISTSLFDDNVLYVLKNADKLDSKTLQWLFENHKKYSSQLLLYAAKPLSATIKKALPKEATVENFDRPKVLWNFLDSLTPGNAKKSIQLYEQVVETEPTELVLSLIGGLISDLYTVSVGGKLSYPSWRAQKIQRQSSRFAKSELASMISQLADIDIASKTSDTDTRLLLELFIVKNL